MTLTTWELQMKENVQAVMGKLNTTVGSTASKLDSLQGGLTKAENGFGKLGGVATSILGGIAAGFAIGGIADLGRDIFKLTAEHEKYNAVLTNSYGSASKAAESMDMLQRLAVKTPFSLDGLTESFIKLKSQGFEPTQNQIMELGDLASSMGKPFDQLAEAVLDAQGMEFERLKEFGIRAEKNGNKVAFTFKGVRTEVDANSDAIQKYVTGLGDMKGVAGSMAAIMDTPLGKLSNLSDTFDMLKIQIGKEIMPVAVRFMEGLMSGLNKVADALTWMHNNWGLIKDILQAVTIGVGAASLAWGILNAGMIVATVQTGILTAAQWLLNLALNANPIGLIIVGIGALVAGIVLLWKRFDWFRGGVTAIFEGLKAYVFGWFGFMKDILSGIGNIIGGLFSGDMSQISGGLDQAGGAFSKYANGIKDAVVKGYSDGIKETNSIPVGIKKGAGSMLSDSKYTLDPLMQVVGNAQKPSAKKELVKGQESVSAGGTQPKNVYVNINKLVEAIHVHSATVKEGVGEIQRIVEETLIRAINGAELSQ